jgi:hypothetical protein
MRRCITYNAWASETAPKVRRVGIARAEIKLASLGHRWDGNKYIGYKEKGRGIIEPGTAMGLYICILF